MAESRRGSERVKFYLGWFGELASTTDASHAQSVKGLPAIIAKDGQCWWIEKYGFIAEGKVGAAPVIELEHKKDFYYAGDNKVLHR